MKREAIRHIQIGAARRRLLVADDMVAADELPKLYRFFRELPYRFEGADRFDTVEHRHLGYRFEDDKPEDHPVVGYFARLATTILRTRKLRVKQLKRAHVNFNLFGDVQFAHEDGDEWTAVVFVNAIWKEDWGGELLVYDDGSLGHAVIPVPGRIAIFDGMLRHRGGVPSKLCSDPRITLALKFAR